MTTHEMRLHPEPFRRIQDGTQMIESRLNDEKRLEIKVGDHIIFSLRPDFIEMVEVEVTELLHAPTFGELFKMRPLSEFAMENMEEAETMYEYYSKEDEAKFGVLGIKFKKI
jgi:ASC-1-like (ASCH) protein